MLISVAEWLPEWWQSYTSLHHWISQLVEAVPKRTPRSVHEDLYSLVHTSSRTVPSPRTPNRKAAEASNTVGTGNFAVGNQPAQ